MDNNMNENNNEVNKLRLKVQALKESFAMKVAEYEDRIADIRVDSTLMYEQLSTRINELENKSNEDVPQED